MESSINKTIQLITEQRETLSKQITEKQYQYYPEYWAKFGEEGKKAGIRDVGFHLNFLIESIKLNDEEIFNEYVKWAKLLFREHEIDEEALVTTIKLMKTEIQNFLPTHLYEIVDPYIHSGLKKIKEPIEEHKSFIDENTQMGKLAKSFNEALLKGQKKEANQMIMEEVQKGTSIKDIYLQVFQPSQMEVGRLWLMNEISVAKEHYVSAATQLIMSQLYPYIFSTERKGLTFVASCVGGELHEIGIRMVGDFFEMDGWDTYYLGANTPVAPLLNAIEENNPDVIGLSISMPYHRGLIKQTIQQIREHFAEKSQIILVGGNGIKNKREIWKQLEADGYAPDAEKAVDLANQLIQDK
jgi:methanogenic corrinoid protein MtbC1